MLSTIHSESFTDEKHLSGMKNHAECVAYAYRCNGCKKILRANHNKCYQCYNCIVQCCGLHNHPLVLCEYEDKYQEAGRIIRRAERLQRIAPEKVPPFDIIIDAYKLLANVSL